MPRGEENFVRHFAHFHIRGAGQDQAKLIAARPSDDVSDLGAILHPLADLDDGGIRDVETIGVIDQAQAVYIDQKIRRGCALVAAIL